MVTAKSSTNVEAFQVLLARMRADFLGELTERCDNLDRLILQLEKQQGDPAVFNELYRGVHSLKGSGGTHGLSIITAICHQLENLLTETNAKNAFGTSFATRALAYVDLLRKVEIAARQENPLYTDIEAALGALRQSALQSRKAVLVVDASRMMTDLYHQAFEGLPLQLTVDDSGLNALARLLHEPFDLIIVGRELKELNGIGMMAALQASQMRNHDVPAILVSSKLGAVPGHVEFKANILRDQHLANNLVKAVRAILKI